MNKPNNKRSRNTDEAIIHAAFAAMVEGKKPVSKITVREICERAQINRSTFYAHYLDVYDLFEKVERHMAEMCQSRMQENFQAGGGFRAALEGVFEFVREYKEFYMLYFNEMNRASYLIQMMNAPYQEQLKTIHRQDMGHGVLEEAAYHFNFFTAGMTSMLVTWLKGGCQESPQQLYQLLERVYGPGSLFRQWADE